MERHGSAVRKYGQVFWPAAHASGGTLGATALGDYGQSLLVDQGPSTPETGVIPDRDEDSPVGLVRDISQLCLTSIQS